MRATRMIAILSALVAEKGDVTVMTRSDTDAGFFEDVGEIRVMDHEFSESAHIVGQDVLPFQGWRGDPHRVFTQDSVVYCNQSEEKFAPIPVIGL